MSNLKIYWKRLNNAQQKTIKICGCISLAFICFYFGKQLIINHFIQNFLKKPPVIGITKPKVKTWHQYYHTVGQLKAFHSTNLSVQSPGIVHKIWVKAGQKVEKDQIILELKADVERANCRIQKAEFHLQQQLFEQQTELYQKKIISKTQFIEAETRLKKAKALYQEARAQLKQKMIKAPFSGIVGIPNVNLGDYINPGQKPLISLQNINTLYLDFYVPEQYFHVIKVHDTLSFNQSLEHTTPYQAKIIAIEPASTQHAHTLWVRAMVQNDNQHWIPGLSVHLKIQTQNKPNTILVSNPCLLGSSRGPIVYVATQKQNPNTKHLDWWIQQRPVTIGKTTSHDTEILSGLAGNEYLVNAGTQKVKDQSFARVNQPRKA